MRVISRDPHAFVVKQCVCAYCGATLEYVPNDVQTRYYKDWSGITDAVHSINCGNCGKELYVSRP